MKIAEFANSVDFDEVAQNGFGLIVTYEKVILTRKKNTKKYSQNHTNLQPLTLLVSG